LIGKIGMIWQKIEDKIGKLDIMLGN